MKRKPPFFILILGVGVFLMLLNFWDLGFFGLHREPDPPRWNIAGGDAARGREVIVRYGCGSCHVVPGIRGANGRVGPMLHGIRDQIYLAGMLVNSPENMVRWIHEPQAINPKTAMPTMGMTEQEARDAAAYLFANP